MPRLRSTLLWGLPWIALWMAATPAHAIIITGGTGRNLTPAPGNLDQYVGNFGMWLGTTIGPRHLVTARHLGVPSSTFSFKNGTDTWQSFSVVEDPISVANASVLGDVAIWTISDPNAPGFDVYAPLYTAGTEAGQALTVIGRGVQRGTPYLNSENELVGWNWGAWDGLRTWGTNKVDAVVNGSFLYGGIEVTLGGGIFSGDFLQFNFDIGGGPNEGIYGVHDSGGPAFALDPADNVWKLAGVGTAVLSGFSNSPDGPYVNAAIYDVSGLYYGSPGDYFQFPNYEGPLGAFSLAARLNSSGRLALLGEFVPVPEPGSCLLLAGGMLGLFGLRCLRRAA